MTSGEHCIQGRLSAHEEQFHSPDNRQQQIRKAVSDHDIEFLAEVSIKGLRTILSYFQGFHDICQELLLTLDLPTAVLTAEYIALHNIRDTMLPSIEPTLSYLRLLPSLLLKVDDEVGRHLGTIQPFYALPFFLTWFAHDMRNREALMRLFDLFIPTHPCMPVYMIAATILCRRELLLDISESEPETLHSELGKLPLPFPTEDLIHQAVKMFNQHPPSTLDGYAGTPRSYCLKTFTLSGRTLSHGDELLDKATREGMAMEEPMHRKSHEAGMQNRYMVIAGLLGLATMMFGVYGRRVFEW
ncbi:hypothetical protein SAICODRAFT_185478 [Saitoella complicata NRRL Y-17804]|uniref:uncharacterized protein n=1 Tax=Saitoella complicata (strain BCRC 22490 / CBS 7301 / JCM 7358 / NBRC 10748 / NRRL Y-17804) TaxID=698492 RepID=UPI000867A656|nr:uncharacterized protein SAICODRAFT_185478 [Saitoella complicata NRRL Y-17804]ODQ55460.1 hypothetical protein SAICODRAFT_185478 [Saitoella complicata NRRL Y-17804]